MTNGQVTMPLGIDVSQWQTTVNWHDVQQAGVAFVFVKATDGAATVDPLFQAHWAGARQAGLLRAPYHFFEPGVDPVQQAAIFANTLQGDPGELPPVLDLEAVAGLTNAALIQAVGAWLLAAEVRLQRTPIIYTSAQVWDNHMRAADGQYPAWAQHYPLWLAHYPWAHDAVDIHTNPLPPLPSLDVIQQFTGQLLPQSWPHWTFWQFTSRGRVSGIDGLVDQDLFNGSLAGLMALANGHQPATGEEQHPHPEHAAAGLTNQDMINIFFKAAKAVNEDGWQLVLKAGLGSMGIPESNRGLAYTGPAIADMPGLTEAERAALQAARLPPANGSNGSNGSNGNHASNGFLHWEHYAVPGLHGPADPGGGWVPAAYDVVRQAHVRGVKMLVPDLQVGEVAALLGIDPNLFIMARLFNGQLGQPRGDGTPAGAGRWFANQVADPGDPNNPLQRAYNAGLRYFEVHNEPNLVGEGLGVNWPDGAGFAEFFQAVVDVLRPRFPGARFGLPGLSPGAAMPARPITVDDFLAQAQPALAAAGAAADFVCCHVYWGQEGVDMAAAIEQVRQYCARFPQTRILCTEFSNNNPGVARADKADEYAQFYQACQALPANLGGMFAYVMSWRDDHNNEGFLKFNPATNGWDMTELAPRLGSHAF